MHVRRKTEPVVSQDLHIILVRPEQPRNVGSVVRAAANFGARSVRLVTLECRDAEFERLARVASSSAWDLLQPAHFQSLSAAVSDCDIVAATSARARQSPTEALDPASFFAERAAGFTSIGLVFGPEGQGLCAEDFALCHAWIRIPASPQFPSLNLGHSVAVVLYEAMRRRDAREDGRKKALSGGSDKFRPASVAEQEVCLSRWGAFLDQAGALRPGTRTRQLAQLRRLLHRSTPSADDIALLEAIAYKHFKTNR